MRETVQKIERAIGEIYNLELKYRAEHFLIQKPALAKHEVKSSKYETADMRGALLIHYDDKGTEPELDLGIYFSEALAKVLEKLSLEKTGNWSESEINAFAIATEEISHFQYLLYHTQAGRAVSELELEIQGDIDKFLLLYFIRKERGEAAFEQVFEKVFENFSLPEHLSRRQIDRYLEANAFAKRCIHKHRSSLLQTQSVEKALHSLRKFYRWGAAEKISALTG